jgi:hypothetical protein
VYRLEGVDEGEKNTLSLARAAVTATVFGGGFRFALNAPPYGRRRAPLSAPQRQKQR